MSISSPDAASQASDSRSVTLRGLMWVTVTAGLAVLFLSGPAFLVAGSQGLLGVLAAAAVCVAPGIAVVLLVVLRTVDSPLATMLAATFIRMGTALVAVLIVQFQLPHLGFADFYLWLVLMYLATLAAETIFLGRHAGRGQQTS